MSKFYGLILLPIIIIIISLPFFLKDPVLGIFHLFQKSSNIYPYTGMFTYNIWSFIGWWVNDSTQFLGVTFQQIGIILFIISLLLITVPLLNKAYFKYNFSIYFAMSLSIMSFFMFLTRMHERYLFPFFAVFVITAFLKKSPALITIYLLLSLIHFANLWQPYFYYNYVFTNSQNSTFFLYNFLSQHSNWFSAINLLLFGVLILIYYKEFRLFKAKND